MVYIVVGISNKILQCKRVMGLQLLDKLLMFDQVLPITLVIVFLECHYPNSVHKPKFLRWNWVNATI